MKFNKFISELRILESLKEVELNRILDKISNKFKLNPKEEKFLQEYDAISDDDIKDYRLLTPDNVVNKVSKILSQKKRIICNLIDKHGKIGIDIKSIETDYENEKITLELRNGEEIPLKDNFLYNIIYDMEKDTYSLEPEDEYFEKIPVENDDSKN